MDLYSLYDACSLCPRECGVNRNRGEQGFCGATNTMQVAYAGLHKGEEPPICGDKGSGTVFFAGCTMQCFFCQNYQISHQQVGTGLEPETLAEIFLTLQQKGAANINLVSGTHFVPGILIALENARRRGLTLPAVWNSSGFETRETLELLRRPIKIFLPDLKILDPELARRVFGLPRYPEYATSGLTWLARYVGTHYHGELLEEGIIMRHLVLPGEVANTRKVLSWFMKNLYGRATLSLMFQYSPTQQWATGDIPETFLRSVTPEEYTEVESILEELEIEEGFIQDLDDHDLSWRPDFTNENPFSTDFSVPVWSQGKFV